MVISAFRPHWGQTGIESEIGCPEGLSEVISRVGGESQLIVSVDRDTTVESLSPFRFGRQRLLKDDRLMYSWSEPLLSSSRPISILRAVSLSREKFGRIEPLAFIGELQTSDQPVSFCVDQSRFVHFGNVAHYLIVYARQAPSP